MKFIGVLLGLAGLVATVQAGAGANQPIPDNDLGLTAKDCSHYCEAKDGLQLWMSIEGHCMSSSMRYTSSSSSSSSSSKKKTKLAAKSSSSSDETIWSPTIVGSMSAVTGLLGMLVGLASGNKYRHRQSQLFPVA
jgi:hypothetical protein